MYCTQVNDSGMNQFAFVRLYRRCSKNLNIQIFKMLPKSVVLLPLRSPKIFGLSHWLLNILFCIQNTWLKKSRLTFVSYLKILQSIYKFSVLFSCLACHLDVSGVFRGIGKHICIFLLKILWIQRCDPF